MSNQLLNNSDSDIMIRINPNDISLPPSKEAMDSLVPKVPLIPNQPNILPAIIGSTPVTSNYNKRKIKLPSPKSSVESALSKPSRMIRVNSPKSSVESAPNKPSRIIRVNSPKSPKLPVESAPSKPSRITRVNSPKSPKSKVETVPSKPSRIIRLPSRNELLKKRTNIAGKNISPLSTTQSYESRPIKSRKTPDTKIIRYYDDGPIVVDYAPLLIDSPQMIPISKPVLHECCICGDETVSKSTECEHHICFECTTNLRSFSCPMCRRELKGGYLNDDIRKSIEQKINMENNNSLLKDRLYAYYYQKIGEQMIAVVLSQAFMTYLENHTIPEERFNEMADHFWKYVIITNTKPSEAINGFGILIDVLLSNPEMSWKQAYKDIFLN